MNHPHEEISLPVRYQAVSLNLLRKPDGRRAVTVERILETTRISRTSLYRLTDKWRKKRSLSDSPRRGRPPKLSPRSEVRLKILAKKQPLNSFKRIAEDYNVGLPQPEQVSLWTIKRHLAAAGILAFRPASKTTLEPRHITERRIWERWYRPMDIGYWQGVVFTDETRILLHQLHPSIKIKRPRNSRYDFNFMHYAEKYGGGGISFWGSITYWGPGPLYRLYGAMENLSYANFLGCLKLDLQNEGIDQFILQDDNLSSHRTPWVIGMRGLLEIEPIHSWPSNSPDLSPIENIWAIWKQRIYARKPLNLDQLEEIAFEEWRNLDPEIFRKLYEGMPKRLALLRKAHWRRIKY